MPRAQDPRVKGATDATGTTECIGLRPQQALLPHARDEVRRHVASRQGQRPRPREEGLVGQRRWALGLPQVHRKRKIKLSTRLEHVSQPIKRHKITLCHHLIDPKATLRTGLDLPSKPMYQARTTTWLRSLIQLVKGCILVTNLWPHRCRGPERTEAWVHPGILRLCQLLERRAT